MYEHSSIYLFDKKESFSNIIKFLITIASKNISTKLEFQWTFFLLQTICLGFRNWGVGGEILLLLLLLLFFPFLFKFFKHSKHEQFFFFFLFCVGFVFIWFFFGHSKYIEAVLRERCKFREKCALKSVINNKKVNSRHMSCTINKVEMLWSFRLWNCTKVECLSFFFYFLVFEVKKKSERKQKKVLRNIQW